MKKTILISILPVFAILLFIAAQQPEPVVQPVQEDLDLGWPEEVMTLFQQSCFDCHTADASNIKAKGKLNFSKWEEYKLTKKIGKLDKISEEVKEKKMPPNRYLKDNPGKALSDDQITIITNWANKEADKLMEE